jgi:hypothetical protein
VLLPFLPLVLLFFATCGMRLRCLGLSLQSAVVRQRCSIAWYTSQPTRKLLLQVLPAAPVHVHMQLQLCGTSFERHA